MKKNYIGFDPRSPTRSYLAHYGILGMKWGVRRFQNKDGSLTKDGKRRYETAENKKVRHKPSSARKLAKQRAENLEKARLAKAEKKQFEEDKKKALESGSAADVLKYKGKLSNQELQNAFNRINLEQQLRSIAQKDVKTGWDVANNIMDKVGTLTNYTNTAINAYNVLAKINNSFSENKMQVIDGGGKKTKDFGKLIKTGSPEDILAAVRSGKLSKAERDEAINRLNAEKTLSDMVKEQNEASKSSAGTGKASSGGTTKKNRKKEASSTKSASESSGGTTEKNQKRESSSTKSASESSGGAHGVRAEKWKTVVNDGSFTPEAGKNYSTSDSDKDRRASANEKTQRAQEWADRKAKQNRDIFEATWTDVKDSSYTSSGRNYANNADFMTLPSGQVILLLPEHK